jgi:uncharacterized membrane protein
MTLISENDVFSMGAVLVGLAWIGFYVDTLPIGRKTSGVIWVLGGAMLLSNFRIIPFEAPAYGFVGGSLMPLAIPLLLFKADLRKIFRESGKVMGTFLIASAATVAGAVLGFYLFDLGDIGPKVAGVYTGGYIGGAVNFVAVADAVKMTDTEFAVSISASSVVSIIALMLLIAIPSVSWIVRKIPSEFLDELSAQEKSDLDETESPRFLLAHITGAVALSFVICAAAQHLGKALNLAHYNILFITLITLVVANILPRVLGKMEGDFELGMLFMYIFFAVVGAGTDVSQFLGSAFVLFAYGMTIILVHLSIVLLVAHFRKIDLAEAVVASGAALVGPTVTAAIAISRGWRSLVTPAIMCGIFGYAIATFIGALLSKFLGAGAAL